VGIGTANNAGAILVLGRDLVVVPKLIHPLPPALSPETSPERHIEDTWMQVFCQIFFIKWFAVGTLLVLLKIAPIKYTHAHLSKS